MILDSWLLHLCSLECFTVEVWRGLAYICMEIRVCSRRLENDYCKMAWKSDCAVVI